MNLTSKEIAPPTDTGLKSFVEDEENGRLMIYNFSCLFLVTRSNFGFVSLFVAIDILKVNIVYFSDFILTFDF